MKHRLTTLLTLIFILLIMSYLWWYQAIKPFDPTDKSPISFSIASGENAKTIADKLYKMGLIRSKLAFYLYTRFTRVATNIQAGDFILNPSMNLSLIANTLTHGSQDVRLTFPEGWRNEEISLKLARELSIPESEFLKFAKIGYMFPDTYLIPKEASASNIAKIFLDNFNNKIKKIDNNKLTDQKITVDELIIIASLVEREARFDEDRTLIAGVILNRFKMGMKLDIDATVQYALGYQPQEKSWWKKNLTLDDINIDSPFNTYKNAGLPPTAIANPGLAAILSVANAKATDYLYYIADARGKSHFAKTIEEHQQNIATYLNR